MIDHDTTNGTWRRARARQRVALAQLERLAEALAYYAGRLRERVSDENERSAAECWAHATEGTR